MTVDKYDLAIEYYKQNSIRILCDWNRPSSKGPSCLFQYVNRSGVSPYGEPFLSEGCGCLTQVKSGFCKAATPDLTREIRDDPSLPRFSGDIRVEHLEHFARWQRRIDKELRGVT